MKEQALLTTNLLGADPESFDIEKFDNIVKDIRNSRRALLDESNDVDFIAKEIDKARQNLETVIDSGDMEEYTEATGKLRTLLKKQKDGPAVQIDKFCRAMNELSTFTSVKQNEDKAA